MAVSRTGKTRKRAKAYIEREENAMRHRKSTIYTARKRSKHSTLKRRK